MLIQRYTAIVFIFSRDFSLGKAAVEINEKLADYVAADVAKLAKKKNIVLLGAAFKANNDDYRDSLSFRLYKILNRISFNKVVLYDPLVDHEKVSKNIKDLNYRKDFFILVTPHKIFRGMLKKIHKKNLYNIWNN